MANLFDQVDYVSSYSNAVRDNEWLAACEAELRSIVRALRFENQMLQEEVERLKGIVDADQGC